MAHNKKYGLREIYNENKQELVCKSTRRKKVVSKRITFQEFKAVIKTYFEIKFEELFLYGDQADISIPLISGYFKIRKMIQKRAFHTLKDNVESKKQGKIVKYKVPILEDWYSVLIWSKRNWNFKRLRVVFSKIPNDKKKSFVDKKGYDNIITKITPAI
tara:strand:+ start:893 stop:1369 length:477 start_codon:yes stop_codon:yes gene_type:complete